MFILLIISFLLFISYAGLLLYYRQGWISLPDHRATTEPSTKVSVVIAARNEEDNISKCLESIRQQTYPAEHFEVIVVDDHSEDRTAEIVSKFGGNIRCIKLADHVTPGLNSFKKKAIAVGIENSNGQLIVTTDADCYCPENWLTTFAAFYESYKPAFIAAPVLISSGNRFIEIFQMLDFMMLQGITGGAVNKGLHNMCNGANLAYEKSAYDAVKGFEGIDNIATGDDMLLMHKIDARFPDRTMYLKCQDAIVNTAPVHSISEFFNQRIRWASKADKYQDRSLFPALLLVYFFNLAMFVLPVWSIFYKGEMPYWFPMPVIVYWIILLVLKCSAELFLLYPVARFFKSTSMLWLFPLLQPFHIVYTLIAGWLGKFGSYKWKGRRVK